MRFIIRFLLFSSCVFIFFSCKSKNDILTEYYNDNSEIHQVMAESLMRLGKAYQADIRIRKQVTGDINVSFYFPANPEPTIIIYDSLLNRNDPHSAEYSKFIIPKGLIKNINHAMYRAIDADSSHVFFGYRYLSKDVYDGILFVDKKQTVNDYSKVIAPNIFISREALH